MAETMSQSEGMNRVGFFTDPQGLPGRPGGYGESTAEHRLIFQDLWSEVLHRRTTMRRSDDPGPLLPERRVYDRRITGIWKGLTDPQDAVHESPSDAPTWLTNTRKEATGLGIHACLHSAGYDAGSGHGHVPYKRPKMTSMETSRFKAPLRGKN